MRIAVTYENGEIFQHFGHTEQFKLYDVEGGKIVAEQLVPTNGSGHGALAGFLKAAQVDALIELFHTNIQKPFMDSRRESMYEKSPEIFRFRDFFVVEISGIEPLTS